MTDTVASGGQVAGAGEADGQFECPGAAEPQAEHAWLQKFVGEWVYEHRASMQPGEPEQTFRGTERVRSLGGLWVVGESEGEMPGGGEARMIITVGYDPAKGCYVGSWVGSMMANMWVYRGELDESRRVLSLHSEGPSFADPTKTSQYKDVVEFVSDDHRTLTGYVQLESGEWQVMMSADYRRQA